MKSVQFQNDGVPAIIQTQQRLLDALLAKSVPVKMLCGGRGLCATCHVYIDKGPECLTPQTDREKLTLSMLTGAQSNSRLACQTKVLKDGVVVSLPRGLYVESFSDIEKLIGKRTTSPILHPVSGRVLIQENKIITRSAISELRGVDFDVQQLNLDKNLP
jgi:ferredoxin